MKSTLAQENCTSQPGYIGWRAGATTLFAGVNNIPPSGTMNLATGYTVFLFLKVKTISYKDTMSNLYYTKRYFCVYNRPLYNDIF
jgi:hypothetical protein